MFPSLELPGIKTLSQVPQWILWRLEMRDGKPTKIPRDPKQGRNASSTNPRTWGTFDEAFEGANRYENDGVGFVFTADDPFIGVDLDKCRDPETGEVEDWANQIIGRLESYTEVSPSGTGVHIICRGTLKGKRRRKGRIECYFDKRYFTVTGESLDDTDIRSIDEPLDWVFDAAAPSTKHTEKQDRDMVPRATTAEHSALEGKLNPFAVEGADITKERFDILCTNARIVIEIWDRATAIGRDWSPSEWDLSLANYFVSAGWPDVDIMCGLIAFRRKHGEDLKLDRDPPSYYYARTILTARAGRERDEAQEMISAVAIDNVPAGMLREHVLNALTRIYSLEITCITRFPGDPNKYEIATVEGPVSGTIDVLLNQMSLRRAMADSIGIVIPKVKAERHDERCQAMLSILDEGSIGAEATEGGQIKSWIIQYINHKTSVVLPEFSEEFITDGHPFYKDAHLWIPGARFQKWLGVNLQVRITTTKFGSMMRGVGCEPKSVNTQLEGKKTSFSAWKIPHEVMR